MTVFFSGQQVTPQTLYWRHRSTGYEIGKCRRLSRRLSSHRRRDKTQRFHRVGGVNRALSFFCRASAQSGTLSAMLSVCVCPSVCHMTVTCLKWQNWSTVMSPWTCLRSEKRCFLTETLLNYPKNSAEWQKNSNLQQISDAISRKLYETGT